MKRQQTLTRTFRKHSQVGLKVRTPLLQTRIELLRRQRWKRRKLVFLDDFGQLHVANSKAIESLSIQYQGIFETELHQTSRHKPLCAVRGNPCIGATTLGTRPDWWAAEEEGRFPPEPRRADDTARRQDGKQTAQPALQQAFKREHSIAQHLLVLALVPDEDCSQEFSEL